MKIGNFQEPSVSPSQAKGDILYWQPAEAESAGMDSYTKLLCHFDVAKATSVLAATGQTLAYRNNADCATGQKQFGAASLYQTNTNEGVTVPPEATWNLGTGNFTIDTWIRVDATTNYSCIVQFGSSNSNCCYLALKTGGLWQFYAVVGESVRCRYDSPAGSPVVADATWAHIAAVRNGTAFAIYVNGVVSPLDVNTAISTNDLGDWSGSDARVAWYLNAASQTLLGYMDEFRFSSIARWTAAFGSVAPTAYADSSVSAGVKTKVTAPINDLIDGMTVVIAGTTGSAYDGTHVISNVTGTTFDIPVVYGSNPSAKGTWSSIPGVAYPYLPAGSPGGSTYTPEKAIGWRVLPIGTTGQTLKVASTGLPAWTT